MFYDIYAQPPSKALTTSMQTKMHMLSAQASAVHSAVLLPSVAEDVQGEIFPYQLLFDKLLRSR